MSYIIVNGKMIKKEKSMLKIAKQQHARKNKVVLKRTSYGFISSDDDGMEYTGNVPRVNFRVV